MQRPGGAVDPVNADKNLVPVDSNVNPIFENPSPLAQPPNIVECASSSKRADMVMCLFIRKVAASGITLQCSGHQFPVLPREVAVLLRVLDRKTAVAIPLVVQDRAEAEQPLRAATGHEREVKCVMARLPFGIQRPVAVGRRRDSA